ncbi:septal ring lytic transglycosylase RlpA family protein [soil metagenome]
MQSFSNMYRLYSVGLIFFLFCAFLSGCSAAHRQHSHGRYQIAQDGPPLHDVDVSKIPNATPRKEAFSRYGNPSSYVANGRRYYVMKNCRNYRERGMASWYGNKFHSHRTSSGEPYSMYKMTAAHTKLPIPSYAKVTNLRNNRWVIVKINDRGPFKGHRLIDLSYVAAKKLGITSTGTAPVEVAVINSQHETLSGTVNYTHNKQSKQTRIYLQVGAFSGRNSAEMLSRRVKQIVPHSVQIQTAYAHNQSLYKVQIGPLVSAADSNKILNKLRANGLGEAKTIIQ